MGHLREHLAHKEPIGLPQDGLWTLEKNVWYFSFPSQSLLWIFCICFVVYSIPVNVPERWYTKISNFTVLSPCRVPSCQNPLQGQESPLDPTCAETASPWWVSSPLVTAPVPCVISICSIVRAKPSPLTLNMLRGSFTPISPWTLTLILSFRIRIIQNPLKRCAPRWPLMSATGGKIAAWQPKTAVQSSFKEARLLRLTRPTAPNCGTGTAASIMLGQILWWPLHVLLSCSTPWQPVSTWWLEWTWLWLLHEIWMVLLPCYWMGMLCM